MATVTIGGHRLSLTNLDKVLYPETGTTKREVVDYYLAVADAMLPHVTGRIGTRKRWPNGVDEDSFFEKNLPKGAPAWLTRVTLEHRSRAITYPVFDCTASLAWLGQQAALELHVPQWRVVDDGTGPATRLVFDLDPGPGVALADCAVVAREVRAMVGELGWSAFPVTSGSKGIHVYVPLDRALTSDGASTVARQVADNLETLFPETVTATMAKSVRSGKVFVDWSQNNPSKTTIAPYSMRGRAHPTVAAPRTWDELDDPDLRQLTFTEVIERVHEFGDLLAGLDAPLHDPLDEYRRKRDPAKTPEPVPMRTPVAGSDTAFVIQEHHARRLHFDLRLEHDGVLASWAVPRNLPETDDVNRLAVRTEDHPIEYLTFHGTIPAGEYGGGEMTIWDTGTYETEKWRDDEVIVVLHGERISGRYALIRTDGKNWLARRTKRQPTADDVGAGTGHGGRDGARPTDVRPMLAVAGEVERLGSEAWAFEGKWDGFRAIVAAGAGGWSATSRSGRDMSADFPALAEVAEALAGHEVVLDGEIVSLDEHGVSSFEALQAGSPVEYRVFDVLYLDGVSLLRKPLDDRRRVLEALAHAVPSLVVPDRLPGPGDDAMRRSAAAGWEGVVAKRRDSLYRPGARSGDWVKQKNWATQSVVIGGWRPGQGSRASGVGALLCGVFDGDALEFVGRVGTGFTDRALRELGDVLAPLRIDHSPFADALPRDDARGAVWVRPDLVGEVRFAQWSSSGRMRHPSWRGLRRDLAPHDVVREAP